ncbi:unnamed protein product [Rotaria sp. Silwood1]|nr:unnamed protein product [Rotaria sp. Silwood1]
MDFGSKYIYKYDHSESESVSDDDDGTLGNDADPLFIPKSKASEGEKQHEQQIESAASSSAIASHRRKRLRKPDTNVLSVKFNRLLQPGEMHAGDPVYCKDCGAIASHLSKIQIETQEPTERDQSNESESKWRCEFCSNTNIVDIEQSDLPKQEDATYLISPAPVVHGSDMTGVDDSIVLFLIDISGSMSSTTLVHGTFHLPNAHKQQERAAEAFGGAPMIRQHRQTYVSRLQGVQMAVDANLDKLVKDTPTRRAALLTFNHELTYFGDGTRDEPLIIRGDKLNNANDLLHEAEKELNKELKPVAETKTKLTERVYDLEEGGQTALGPAVVFALNIASKRQGSKIVICTDGLANRGLGSLETAQDEKVDEAIRNQALEEGNQFYAELTERAREKGVSISVITIKALGPAVVFALNIASKRQGSKIVICTDGLANRGLGSLETAQDEKVDEAIRNQALEEGNQFYAELTERAREKGVSISVITIKGTACLLPVIGQMADGTGGNVTIVDLLNMRDEFASILEQKTIATNVEATLIVHRGLYIRNPDNLEDKLDKIKRDIGNVTKQTEVTFEFGVRNKEEIKEKYHIDLDQLEQLPFQVQVTYTAVDGSKALRVLTQLREATENREVAEVNAIRSVIAENHIRSTANDMMAAISDEEEYEIPRTRSKWSTPVVQKQRVAYMDNLNTKVRSRGTYETDQFNERRWNAASNELQRHVISSRSRKADALRHTPPASTSAAAALPPPSKSGGSLLGAIGDRVSRLFTGSNKEDASERNAVVLSSPSRSVSKRSYGFATSNLSHFSDQHSEDLYRYKNISSDYMRESSPTRDDNQPAITLSTNRVATRRYEMDDQPPVAPSIRHSAGRRNNDDDQSGNTSDMRRVAFKRNTDDEDIPRGSTLNTGRSATRQNDNDDQPATASSTGHFSTRRHDEDEQPANAPNTDRFSGRRHDEDDQPTGTSNMSRFSGRRHDEDDQPANASNTGRFSGRRSDEDDQPTNISNMSRFSGRHHDEDDQPANASNTGRFSTRRHDDDNDT